jgi:hypothetical protein
MPRRSYTPMALAALTAVVSIGLLWLAIANGWLGPDVGRGDGFCEAARHALIEQPANTLSNGGFVVAGLVIGWHAGDPRRTIAQNPTLATAYAMIVVLLGPASAAMHATQSAAGGHLDLLSMYLIAAFAFSYAVTRLSRRGTWTFAGLWVAAIAVCEVVERIPGEVPVVMVWANLAFGLLLVAALVGEALLWRRGESTRNPRWGLAAVGAMGLAFAIWTQAKTGSPLCRPHSLIQGHAIWHLLDALAAYCLYRLYASERRRTPSTPG